ncbi:hypothetical protein WA577_005728, partial [Blastocystis sp. JDR]
MKCIRLHKACDGVGVCRFLFLGLVLLYLLNGEEIEVDVHNGERKTVDDSRVLIKEIKELNKRIEKIDQEFNDKQEVVNDYEKLKNDKVNSLESRIRFMKKKIEGVQKDIATEKKSIDKNKQQIRKLSKEYNERNEGLNVGGFLSHFVGNYVTPLLHTILSFLQSLVRLVWNWILRAKNYLYIKYLEVYTWLQQFDTVVSLELQFRQIWRQVKSALKPVTDLVSPVITMMRRSAKQWYRAIMSGDMKRVEKVWNRRMKQVSDLELKLRANPATAQYSQLLTAAIVIAYVVLLLTLLQLCVSLITAVCGFLLRWK